MGPHSEATARWWRLCGIWEFARRFPVAICGGKRGIQPVAAGGRVDLVTPWARLAKGWPNTWRCFFASHTPIFKGREERRGHLDCGGFPKPVNSTIVRKKVSGRGIQPGNVGSMVRYAAAGTCGRDEAKEQMKRSNADRKNG